MNNADIFHIIRFGKFDLYKKLANDIDVNIKNEFGQSLLHTAITYRQTEIVLDLLDRSIDINTQDNKGRAVMHYLCYYPDVGLAKLIINEGGRLDIIDCYGNTPLWYAVFNARGFYDLVILFMKNNANAHLKNNSGKSPLDFALKIGDEELVRILKM